MALVADQLYIVGHSGSTQQLAFMGADVFMPFIKAELIPEPE